LILPSVQGPDSAQSSPLDHKQCSTNRATTPCGRGACTQYKMCTYIT